MRNSEQQKDLFLIAKKIHKQEPNIYDFQSQLDQRYKKESQEALKMINAYRKVQNLKFNQSNQTVNISKNEKTPTQVNHQPKSLYANKIKQTLRQLNANKAKQYEKISQKNSQINSIKNIHTLQVTNKIPTSSKSENQKKLINKSVNKIFNVFISIVKRFQKQSFRFILESSQANLLQDYKMAIKYRIFRLFSLWKQQTQLLKTQNEKKRKERQEKQIQSEQLAKEFYNFKTSKKVMRSWSRITMNQKKKRKYEQEIKKIEAENKKIEAQNKRSQKEKKTVINVSSMENGPLQNKLRGFLDGLKQKIQHKDTKPKLQSIQQRDEQSQRNSELFSQGRNQQKIQNEIANQNEQANNQQVQENQNDQQLSSEPQKPLSNEQLQKKRQQIYERSKNRKQALQKLKKEKQISKKKEEEERRQLEKKIEQEERRIKELKYKEFQERKRLEKEWQQRQAQLNTRAEEWNRLRILKYYGFQHWKNIKLLNAQKMMKLGKVLEKIMIKYTGQELLQALKANLDNVLFELYEKMNLIHERNLKRKALKGYRRQKDECIEQKISLEAFHQVHTQKIILAQWKNIMDLLRLQNLQEQRPLIKKANDYHRVSLMLKSLHELKNNAIECKKEKNIKEQKMKIKSKIKDIINEKIEINFEDFL